MICPKCGNNIPNDSKSCPHCSASTIDNSKNELVSLTTMRIKKLKTLKALRLATLILISITVICEIISIYFSVLAFPFALIGIALIISIITLMSIQHKLIKRIVDPLGINKKKKPTKKIKSKDSK